MTVNYPPDKVFNPSISSRKDFEYILLWMLDKNEECLWSDFIQDPLKLKLSTLSKYLSLLNGKGYVDKPSRAHYKITIEGRNRFLELTKQKESKTQVIFPPSVIRRRRNYGHWILWMVYNNDLCKWTDFLAPPLSINNSSLSKNMRILIEKGLVKKENKIYRITQLGKIEYPRILKTYNLDRQSILDEEIKRIEEIAKKTIIFFEKYKINNEDLQFRFLNNILRLDYSRISSVLSNEEDFEKIILYISINHPKIYPNHISFKEFSMKYGIKENSLTYYVEKIMENRLFQTKFFGLDVLRDKCYYFQENEKIESALRIIVEDHITKYAYLNKLHSRAMDLQKLIDNIVEETCTVIFNEGLKDSLQNFLPSYINYLAYKTESRRIVDINDKLEGIIWQDMIDIFESKGVEDLQSQLDEELKKVNKAIETEPRDLELYYSKIKILISLDNFDEVLHLLNKMLSIFPQNEIDIKIKLASVLKRMLRIEDGLEIINELIKDYPKNKNLLSYKAYWLQYLNKKEESIGLIQELIVLDPKNALHHDTFGEILLYFKEYKESAQEFMKTIELSSNTWFLYQTHIKLGICYKELKNYNLAIENFNQGKDLAKKSLSDPTMKQKWLAIAELYLNEIERSQ